MVVRGGMGTVTSQLAQARGPPPPPSHSTDLCQCPIPLCHAVHCNALQQTIAQLSYE